MIVDLLHSGDSRRRGGRRSTSSIASNSMLRLKMAQGIRGRPRSAAAPPASSPCSVRRLSLTTHPPGRQGELGTPCATSPRRREHVLVKSSRRTPAPRSPRCGLAQPSRYAALARHSVLREHAHAHRRAAEIPGRR